MKGTTHLLTVAGLAVFATQSAHAADGVQGETDAAEVAPYPGTPSVNRPHTAYGQLLVNLQVQTDCSVEIVKDATIVSSLYIRCSSTAPWLANLLPIEDWRDGRFLNVPFRMGAPEAVGRILAIDSKSPAMRLGLDF